VYEAFFRLCDSPFRLTPDPRFLYLSAKHAEALAHLRLGLTEPGGFVCITGEIGTGKTTVLRTFLDDLGPEVATAFVFNPTLSWEDLLQRIARELGVPAGGTRHVDVMDALNAHLLAQRKEGRTAVVVIDEAQAMALEVLERLRLLSNLETSTEKLLRLVLVGQPQLARLLLDPSLAQLNQRITLRWHLRALTRKETITYVRHRLAVAGSPEAVSLFTRPALNRVHRYSGGVPRLVNMIAHRAMLAAYVKRRRRVTATSVRSAYREIRAVPLTSRAPSWRLGWVVGAVAACIGLITIGTPRLGLRPWAVAPTSAPASAPVAAPVMAAVGPVPAAVPVAPPEIHPAPQITPPPPVEATATTPPPPPTAAVAADDGSELERQLAAVPSDRSLRAAVATVLSAWRVAALAGDEKPESDSLEAIAHRRELEDLRLTGNLSMLRLLNLPAVLEMRPPGATEPSFAAVTGIDDDLITLTIGTETMRVAPTALDRVWFGDAHVLWRDFEWLGPTFGSEAKGANVARLQRLLTQVGSYKGPANGAFDHPTESAVVGFQHSRRLDADSRVGRLTRIALYGAAGSYRMPTLAHHAHDGGDGPIAQRNGGAS
jgi:general secretion pathway protein A